MWSRGIYIHQRWKGPRGLTPPACLNYRRVLLSLQESWDSYAVDKNDPNTHAQLQEQMSLLIKVTTD